MKKNRYFFRNISFLFLSLFLLSCSTKDSECKFDFNGFVFLLPMKVKEIKEKIPLKFEPYVGFTAVFDTAAMYSMCSIQIENHPFWSGSDNDVEDDYLNKKVVGITFSKQFNEEYFMQLKDELSLKYKISFSKQRILTSGSVIDYEMGSYVNCKIILFNNGGILRVSFYGGITNDELQEYIQYSL